MLTLTVEILGSNAQCQGQCDHCHYGTKVDGGNPIFSDESRKTYAALAELQTDYFSLGIMNKVKTSALGALDFINNKPDQIFVSLGTSQDFLAADIQEMYIQYGRWLSLCKIGGSVHVGYQNQDGSIYEDSRMPLKILEILSFLSKNPELRNSAYSVSFGSNTMKASELSEIRGKIEMYEILLSRVLDESTGGKISINKTLEYDRTILQTEMTINIASRLTFQFMNRYIGLVKKEWAGEKTEQLINNPDEFNVSIYPEEVRLCHTTYTIHDRRFSFSHQEFRHYLQQSIESGKSPTVFFQEVIKERQVNAH